MLKELSHIEQEEYIWAMRSSFSRDPDSWRDKQSTHSIRTLRKKSKSRTDSIFSDDHQTKVMASLVPDEVIYNFDDYRQIEYKACFLFGDVSGFTELCEKYSKTGVAGPSRMTQVLNKYLGSMVQEIMSLNGDVLKFSGDAFLAMFKSTESETLRDAVHEALDCALIIQKEYGSYLTDVGVAIRVKLAISAGLVTFALIGDETNSHYVVVGQPIWDVKAAESISSAGEIIIAPAAWNLVNSNEYLFQEMPDNVHVKIIGVGPNWRSVQKNLKQPQKFVEESDNVGSKDSSESDDISELTQEIIDEFSFRPAVNLAVRLKIKEHLRRFIIAPVMKSIDNDEPFEYLTEMRHTVIVVINVVSYTLETEETVKLADHTYKTVCRVVDKNKGCVNKVSLFDKDLMFVVIFGLRGLKHELECQVALKCARQCHAEINKLTGVVSTSIGVTTGKTYCGVFGHSLRREYTVISLVVNKAARLMVNYKGKVTCDKETFLHSKLEARHFILQEYKPLKGISHPGPVYEFVEAEIDPNIEKGVNACPLLGHSSMLELYTHLLKKNLETSNKQTIKMLLIKGEARQGKSRVLDEIVYITPPEIRTIKFTLSPKDQKNLYKTMQLIFNVPLSMTSSMSDKEKQNILKQKLDGSEWLCALNGVFGLNFPNSYSYMTLTPEGKLAKLKETIKLLCGQCFVKDWVLAIDDCEYIDYKSWKLFSILFDVKKLFIVATISRDKNFRMNLPERVLQNPRVKTIFLQPIERWYLGALACQILGVHAISPELENAIQTKSRGNPGWIESFLISMVQEESLYILEGTFKEINDLGLVCPPRYMMVRLTPAEKRKWQHIMEERRPSMTSLTEHDFWKRYIDSCRDNYLNVTVREQMEAIGADRKVPICVVAPNFVVGDEEAEISTDTKILKTFDSLNFFEQLLVKCSAILGNQFFREMLLYVMSASNQRKAALAVQKLFEMRVLTCGKGDFVESGMRVFKERLLNPHDDLLPKCQCRGLSIHESCKDLPTYASCGYLQFRSPQFRDITYNLLTDNQKKEFHQRAIKFLERETRKCKACGGGYFDNIFVKKHDEDFIVSKIKERKPISTPAWDIASISQFSGYTKRSRDERSLSSYRSHGLDEQRDGLAWRGKSDLRFVGEKLYQILFGFFTVNKLKSSTSMTRDFATEDFTDCQCNLILAMTFAQLINHCTAARDLNKVMDCMMEYSQICINLSNIPLALRILDDLLDVIEVKSTEKMENAWILSLIRAKVYSLIGYCRLELGQVDDALLNLHKSLAEYDIKFPRGIFRELLKYAHELKQCVGLHVYPKCLIKTLDYWEIVFANDLSECLAHLSTIYMIRREWKKAELAAAWSLTTALKSFSNFQIISTACANMLLVTQYFRKWKLALAVEMHALTMCYLKKTSIVAEDLKSVVHLYSVIFYSRLQRFDLEKAINIGFTVLRMSSSVSCPGVVIPLLSLLSHCLLIGRQINDVNLVLYELHTFADEGSDSLGKVWFYALCLTFQLETGYSIVSYKSCEEFYQVEGWNLHSVSNFDARKRFYTTMWLWCLRNEKWASASLWCTKDSDFMSVEDISSFHNIVTALYLLEGLLLLLVNKMDKRNSYVIKEARTEVRRVIKSVKKIVRRNKILLPRFYHLMAYYKFLRVYDSKVCKLLDKGKQMAEKNGNFLEMSWIEHTQAAWDKTLSPLEMDRWKDNSEDVNLMDFKGIDEEGATMWHFTLPTPMYM